MPECSLREEEQIFFAFVDSFSSNSVKEHARSRRGTSARASASSDFAEFKPEDNNQVPRPGERGGPNSLPLDPIAN
jgi:hypothetical protein